MVLLSNVFGTALFLLLSIINERFRALQMLGFRKNNRLFPTVFVLHLLTHTHTHTHSQFEIVGPMIAVAALKDQFGYEKNLGRLTTKKKQQKQGGYSRLFRCLTPFRSVGQGRPVTITSIQALPLPQVWWSWLVSSVPIRYPASSDFTHRLLLQSWSNRSLVLVAKISKWKKRKQPKTKTKQKPSRTGTILCLGLDNM